MFRLLAAMLATRVPESIAGCGGDDESDASASAPAATPAPASTNGCEDVEQPEPRDGGGQNKPKATHDPGRRYDVTLVTTCGDMTFRLAVATSPHATASFVSLAKAVFVDRGMNVAARIDKLGDPNGGEQGTPLQSVVIESAKVHVSS